MARVTAEFRKQYAPYTRNGLLQIIAEMRETAEEYIARFVKADEKIEELNAVIAKMAADVERATEGRELAEQSANEAASNADDAEWERDKLQEGITRLEDEARYARGMKLPTAKTYADAVADYAGLSPHNIERLV
jgi:chromosome segregation ATPase